jgi:hypothetical protein
MAAYRLLAAQHLATGVSPLAVFGDATLAAFPNLLADYQLLSVSLPRLLRCLGRRRTGSAQELPWWLRMRSGAASFMGEAAGHAAAGCRPSLSTRLPLRPRCSCRGGTTAASSWRATAG